MILKVPTSRKTEFVDITAKVAQAVAKLGAKDGLCMIYVPHTTAGVTINEAADPDVARDILTFLNKLVPEQGDYRHGEGNSPAHIKSSLVGSSQIVAVESGRLALGTWQGVFFCEFDGPRNRKVKISLI